MVDAVESSAPRRLLRPHSHLFRQGVTACVAFMTPVFAVLLSLTIPDGPWVATLVVMGLAAIAITLAAIAYFRAAIWIDPAGITERGFFGLRRHVPMAAIGSIVMAQTFDGSGPQSVPQLFVCDLDGRQVMRMRGQFWSRENMNLVIETLDVPFDPIADTLSARELRRDYPGLLYWFERHPGLAALALIGTTAAVGALVLLVFRVAG